MRSGNLVSTVETGIARANLGANRKRTQRNDRKVSVRKVRQTEQIISRIISEVARVRGNDGVNDQEIGKGGGCWSAGKEKKK